MQRSVTALGIQRDGYAAAFRHPDVISAIRSGPLQSIAVTYVEWAGPEHQVVVLPWTIINSEAAARSFSDRLLSSPPGRYSGTSISGGLLFSAAAFTGNGFAGERRVIDVSGDGPNNRGMPVEPVRTEIVAQGITINGLPLLVKEPFGPYSIDNLDVYYEDCVIGGPGSFVIPINNRDKFLEATRTKLVLEIAGYTPKPRVIPASAAKPRISCMIGERMWQYRWGGGRDDPC